MSMIVGEITVIFSDMVLLPFTSLSYHRICYILPFASHNVSLVQCIIQLFLLVGLLLAIQVFEVIEHF